MNWVADRMTLVRALGIAGRAVPQRSPLAILDGVLVRALHDRLTLETTDLTVRVETAIDTPVADSGLVVLPFGRLLTFVGGVSGETVTCQVTDSVATLTCGGSRVTVRLMALTDWPVAAPFDGIAVVLDAAALATALRQVVYAAGNGKDRPILKNVQWRIDTDGVVMLAAADGMRASVATVQCVDGVDGVDGEILLVDEVLLDEAACGELARVLTDGQVTMTVGELAVSFAMADTTLTVQRTVGQYPNWSHLMPLTFARTVTCATADLLREVQLIRRLGGETVCLETAEAGLHVWAVNQEEGEARGIVMATVDGTPGKVGLDTRFIVEALGPLASEEVCIGMNGIRQPVLLWPVVESGARALMMPRYHDTWGWSDDV